MPTLKRWNANLNQWEYVNAPNNTLSGLEDVVLSNPASGQVLTYESVSGIWVNNYVNTQNGYELNELHDVLITNPTSGQILQYNAVSGIWENQTIIVPNSYTDAMAVSAVAASGGYLTEVSASATYATITSLQNYATTAHTHSEYLPVTNPTVSGTLTSLAITANSISGTFNTYNESYLLSSISTSAVALNYSNNRNFVVTHSAPVTALNISNVPSSGVICPTTVIFVTTNSSSLTLPASWKFTTTPTAPTNNKTNIYSGFTYDGGTNWYMVYVGAI